METMATTAFDITAIRKQFPIIGEAIGGKKIIYLDNAATTQKPLTVIDAITDYYKLYNANVHRGVHYLSQVATEAMEDARQKIATYINANKEEVIFTSGATDSINLVASSLTQLFKAGDEIIISSIEHHSNIVPWQLACERLNLKLRVIPMFESGELDIAAFEKMLNERVKLVSVCYVSNSLGTINPLEEIIQLAHARNIPVMVDAAQAVQHIPVNVKELDCDFLAFSGHKMYGPTGIGVLYGKKEWLQTMPPYRGGGEMIKTVTFEKTTYNDLPFKFEAGTPHVEGIIGLGFAVDYINSIGLANIMQYEHELLEYGTQKLSEIDGIKFIGTAKNKSSVISFLLKDIHPYDCGVILDKLNIAVRTGHHCTQPIMDFLKIPGTVRASFALYNTKEEIDELVKGLHKVSKMLA